MSVSSNYVCRSVSFEEVGGRLYINKIQKSTDSPRFSHLVQQYPCHQLEQTYKAHIMCKLQELSAFEPSFISEDAGSHFASWRTTMNEKLEKKLSDPIQTLRNKVAKRVEQFFVDKGARKITLGCMHVNPGTCMRQTHTPNEGKFPLDVNTQESHEHRDSVTIDWRVSPSEEGVYSYKGRYYPSSLEYPPIDLEGPDFARRDFLNESDGFLDFSQIGAETIYAERVPFFERGPRKSNNSNIHCLEQIFYALRPGGKYVFDLGFMVTLFLRANYSYYTRLLRETIPFLQAKQECLSRIKNNTDKLREFADRIRAYDPANEEGSQQWDDLMEQCCHREASGAARAIMFDPSRIERQTQEMMPAVKSDQSFMAFIAERIKLDFPQIQEETDEWNQKIDESCHHEAKTRADDRLMKDYLESRRIDQKKFLEENRDAALLNPETIYIKAPGDYFGFESGISISLHELRAEGGQEALARSLNEFADAGIGDERIIVLGDNPMWDYQLECYNQLRVNPDAAADLLPENKILLDEVVSIYGNRIILPLLEQLGFERVSFDIGPNPENGRPYSYLVHVKRPEDPDATFKKR